MEQFSGAGAWQEAWTIVEFGDRMGRWALHCGYKTRKWAVWNGGISEGSETSSWQAF